MPYTDRYPSAGSESRSRFSTACNAGRRRPSARDTLGQVARLFECHAADGSCVNDFETAMYGAAVRCKRLSSICRLAVLHQCIRPRIGACCAPGHHGNQRAYVLIKLQTSSGPLRSPDFACAAKTDPPSRLMLSQTSAGIGKVMLRRHRCSFSVQFLCLCH